MHFSAIIAETQKKIRIHWNLFRPSHV